MEYHFLRAAQLSLSQSNCDVVQSFAGTVYRLYFHFAFHNLMQEYSLMMGNSSACLTRSFSPFVVSLIFDGRLHANLMLLYDLLYELSTHYLNFVILLFLLDCQRIPAEAAP